MKTVKIVIGANFGDEGKGLMTDYFASKNSNSIVVMHNGGAQRGHTVVTPEGIRHVFHHFSAGTYTGAATYLSKDFIVNPVLFRQEYEKLVNHGVKPKVFINPRCKLTTIYDMLINQVIEADRGADKHGSCGVGVFETLYRNQHGIDFKNKFEYNPLKMEVQEFEMFNFIGQISFLDCVRKEYVPKRFNIFGLKNISIDFLNVLNSDNAMINFIDDYCFMRNHSEWADDDIVEKYDNVIFENAQGLLLDQHNMDYFPHLTPSNTGIKNPVKILNKLNYQGFVEACYVTRTYMTRHGVGRFDSECEKSYINSNMVDMTNVPNPFQDNLRYGTLDLKELNKRIKADIFNNDFIFMINPAIAFTHINEFDKNLSASNPSWLDILDSYKIYLSNGYTRNEVKGI